MMLEGIDVSDVQGFPKWEKVKAAGIEYAFCKATEGTTFQAKRFKYNWKGIKANNIIRGAYHFARTINDPLNDAKNFVKTVGNLDDSDMLVLDIEDKRSKLNKSQFISWVLTFMQYVEKETGIMPILYTYGPYFTQHAGYPTGELAKKLARYPFWLAAYTKNPDKYLPGVWKDSGWTIWQRSGEISAPGDKVLYVPGINVVVDRNQFKGNREDFLNFAKSLHDKKPEDLPVIEPYVHPEPTAWNKMSELIGSMFDKK